MEKTITICGYKHTIYCDFDSSKTKEKSRKYAEMTYIRDYYIEAGEGNRTPDQMPRKRVDTGLRKWRGKFRGKFFEAIICAHFMWQKKITYAIKRRLYFSTD